MTTDGGDLAPLHPAIHLAPPRGWMNDPNGLCYAAGRWHAFYQYDPSTDVHGTMRWGHATSRDLLQWDEQPVALLPDEHGVIFSGSAVVDVDNTAGFGAGAMVAVFTHHLDGKQSQSLAYSLDEGASWTKYIGNPVLESDEPDFRDPKIRRYINEGRSVWVMTLAVGHRVEFYRSDNLREWTLSGSFGDPMPTGGVWECPDLLSIVAADGSAHWFLVVGVIDGGPFGHSGTLVVPGRFDGNTFIASAPAALLDHGPDYYAAQSFWGAPADVVVQMGWLNSWTYAQTHPSRGRRGVQSIPRRLAVGRDGQLMTTPFPDLASIGVPTDNTSWRGETRTALHIAARGEIELSIGNDAGRVAQLHITPDEVTLERFGQPVAGYTQTYRASRTTSGRHEIVVDHGTIEIFADDGSIAMSALFFAGERWHVGLDGDGTLTAV